MKLRLPRRRLWRVAIYIVSFWLVVTAIDLVLVQVRREVRPGYETTRIIAPTLPDGRIDYLVAVDEHFGRGVTPENNAAVLALRAWGRWALSPNQPTNGVTDRLGMEPLPAKGDYWVEYDDDREALKERNEFDGLNVSPTAAWPPTVGPRTRQWVAANERPLRLLTEASRRPRFFIPFYAGNRPETMMETLLTHVIPLQETARALLARASLRLGAGDAAGFRADVLAVHRWARLLAQGPTLVERHNANLMEVGACRVERAAAAGGALPAADARALAADLGRLAGFPSPADAVDHGERYLVLDICQWVARGGPGHLAVFLDVILSQGGNSRVHWWTRAATTFLPVNYEESTRSMNAFYDGAVVAWRQPTWAARREAMRLWEEEGERAAHGSVVGLFLTSRWPTIYLLPSLTRAMEEGERTRAELLLTRVALGLAAFKAERGAYPTALADLSPGFVPDVPTDPFTGAPFVYARTEGGYRLYSVGPNMKDDGGTDREPADDVSASSARPTLTTAPTTR
jgi:hypothetical protein